MAKKFNFKLAPVLRYREMIEKEKLRDFATANLAAQEEQLKLDELGEQRTQTQDDVREMYEQKMPFANIVEAYRYVNTLDFQVAMGSQKLQQLEVVADQKREVLIEARRDKRSLEVLKDKQLERHDKEAAREEQAEIDEISIRKRQSAKEEE